MARQRLPYVVVGRAMRHSAELARKGGATPAERVVLAAVHEFTTSYSKLHDRVTLGQLAVVAGLWDGEPRHCPRKTTKRVAERLRRLDEMGAIAYVPASRGRGSTSIVVVTRAAEIRDSQSPPFIRDPEGPPSEEEGGPFESERGTRKGQNGDAQGPPPEESSEEDCSEQPPQDPSARKDTFEEDVKAEAYRRWQRRKSNGEQLGVGVRRLIEADVRQEWADRARPDLSFRDLLESYAALGRRRGELQVTEEDLRAELAGDPNIMRFPDLLAAAVTGLHGGTVVF